MKISWLNANKITILIDNNNWLLNCYLTRNAFFDIFSLANYLYKSKSINLNSFEIKKYIF